MARVDPDDDSIRRFVVQHRRYVPERRQYRRVPVAAFDNQDEFYAAIEALRLDLERRRRAGEDVDPHEGATGTEYAAGDRDSNAYRRFLKRSFEHGVDVRPFLAQREAPGGLVFIFFDGDDPATEREDHPSQE